jgi:hypothetical protein
MSRRVKPQRLEKKFIFQSNSDAGTPGRPVCCFFVFLGNLSLIFRENGQNEKICKSPRTSHFESGIRCVFQNFSFINFEQCGLKLNFE